MTVSHINHFKTSSDYVFGLLNRTVRIPVVSDQGKPKVLGESGRDVVFFDVISIKVDAPQNALIIFEASNDSGVVVGVKIVPFFVANAGEIVGVFLGGKLDSIIKDFALLGEILESSGDLLKIGILSTGGYQDVVGDFFVPADIGVFWVRGGVLSRLP